MNEQGAQLAGLQVLGWLAAQDELFAAFLGATGASAAEVRAAATQGALLISVLDFVLESDDRVIAAAESAGLKPTDISLARAVLGGRDQMHWT